MRKIFVSLFVLLFTLPAFADVHCRFDPTGAPSSYLRYSPKSKTIWTLTGWPQKWKRYNKVLTVKGPVKKSVILVVFGDVPAITIQYSGNGKIWYDSREVSYPFVANWGKIPGAPTRQSTQGVCWTDRMQPVLQAGAIANN